jgi:uncharacterized protein (TIGR02284 family)
MAEIVDTLNDLIATCRDSEEGFGKAAKGCHSDALRNRFIGIARRRADFAGELAEHVRKLGAAPAASAHESGLLHAGWRELEESIRPKDDTSFIVECLEGEENTLRHYETALTRDLPVAVRPVVESQRLAVQETLLELRSIEMVRRAG